MNLLDAAERLAAIDRSEVVLDRARCLHAGDRFANCTACSDGCPVDAIHAGKPPELDPEACVTCLACLPACPVGAFTADDAVPALLNCTARLEAAEIELVCEVHPDFETGPSPDSAAVQVKGCLAGLGASVYLALLLLGVERIVLRAEACADCPVGQLSAEVHAWAARANRLLAPWGFSDRLTLLTALPGEPLYARPSWSASDPPLSRRDLFRLASRQGQIAAARAVLKDSNEAHKLPGRERRRLLAVLPRMPEPQHAQTCQPEDGFGWIELEGSCTACGVCARACPTGALSFLDEEDTYTLGFDPRLCIGCAACTHVCAPDVLLLDQTPDLQQVFAISDALVLQSGEFSRCKRCKARFAAVSDAVLCPVCTFRSKNPFGTALPPALLGRSKSGEPL